MDNFEIRLALRADARHIAEMSRDHIEYGLGWHYQHAQILEKIRDPDVNVIAAWHESKLAGFAIMNYQGFEAHLVLFAVLPAYRRRGAGTALLRWLIKTAEVAGAQAVYVELRKTNAVARAFYQSLGFKRMEQLREYYRGQEDGLRMALDLRHSA